MKSAPPSSILWAVGTSTKRITFWRAIPLVSPLTKLNGVKSSQFKFISLFISTEQAASLYRTLGMKEHLKTCLISWKMALRYRSRATSDQEEVAVLRDLLFRKAAEVNLELRTLELENSAEHHAVHPVCIQTARNMQYLLCV